MQLLKKFSFTIFGLFAVGDIILMLAELGRYRYLTKPFLLPLLLLTILANVSGHRHPVSKPLLIAAMLAGTLGDILLMGGDNNKSLFIYGLLSFLVMQLLYSIYFFKMQSIKSKFLVNNIIILVGLGSYSSVLVIFLWNFLGDLKLPVIVYAVVISIMFFSAANIYHSRRAQKLAVRYFIPGAALLVLSDSILAINKFYLKADVYAVSVMVTYILGQVFLSLGFIRHFKSNRHTNRRKKEMHDGEEEMAVD